MAMLLQAILSVGAVCILCGDVASAFAINVKINPTASNNPRAPGTYYANIDTRKSGTAFQAELTALISVHTSLSYSQLWTAFQSTNEALGRQGGCPDNRIDDIYSTNCWTPVTQQCGNFKAEGDCYNREHSWPKSAWGGSTTSAAYTDLFHVYPSDGYDNGRRSNYWLGLVDRNVAAKYVTNNGSRLGNCVAPTSITNTTNTTLAATLPTLCWEPSDEYKGELARVYFYMETRYMDEFTCCDTEGTSGAVMKPWLRDTLREWHARFPVSAAETKRADIIYSRFQQNRNPFVDFPEWVEKIYSTQ